jgi:hypothetical protein
LLFPCRTAATFSFQYVVISLLGRELHFSIQIMLELLIFCTHFSL